MPMASGNPTTEAMDLVQCGNCKQTSPTSRRYCGTCGHMLWEPCLECEEFNSVRERFCGKCGADTAERLNTTRQALETALTAADEKAQLGRFLDAVAVLRECSIPRHSQLAELADQIRQRIEQFPQRREQAIEHSNRVLEMSQRLLQEFRYEQAVDELRQVPEAFRTREIHDMLAEAETRWNEVQTLRAEVNCALKQKIVTGLLGKVQRLAELVPADDKVRRLRLKLEKHELEQQRADAQKLLRAAKSALMECNYPEAGILGQQISDRIKEDEQFTKVLLGLKERVWLAEQLSREPYVSPTLILLAERLQKLQPHDSKLAETLLALKGRWAKSQESKDFNALAWAKAKGPSPLGLPVLPLPLPKELLAYGKNSPSVSQGLLVAFGLALQAMGAAAIDVELGPKNQGGWLQRITQRDAKKRPSTTWGIDLGSKNLKAVRLVVNGQTNSLQVAETVVLPLPPSTGKDDLADRTRPAVERFLAKFSLQGEVVAINFPGAQTLHRFFDLPAHKPKKFLEAVQYEVRARIPLASDDLEFDYHWIDIPRSNDNGVPQRRVTLVAANKLEVERRVQLFRHAQPARLIVQSDSVALSNCISHIAPQAAKEKGIGVVELGASTCNFVGLTRTRFWFRGLFEGANAFDQALATALQTTLANAQQIRVHPEKQPYAHTHQEALKKKFQSLVEELERTLTRFRTETGEDLSLLYLCGAGSGQFGLLRYMQAGDC